METFTKSREFVENPRYARDRQATLGSLDLHAIDGPIAELIHGFSVLPHCFTLQSCYGHFLYAPGQDTRSLDRLPSGGDGTVNYKIAYVAFCLENSRRGRALREALEGIPAVDPDFVQFGSADWFWGTYLNSYVLQVEPTRHRTKDQVAVEYPEALHLQHVRDLFYIRLKDLLESALSEHRPG